LQTVLEAVEVPVIAAGGIASARGVAAALAAGAEGVWVGTCLLASPECENSEQARSRLVQAQETDTTVTRVFDVAQGLSWPARYPGRALRNRFTEQWDAQIGALSQATDARQQLAEAVASENYDFSMREKLLGWLPNNVLPEQSFRLWGTRLNSSSAGVLASFLCQTKSPGQHFRKGKASDAAKTR
jgi:NAD(P)H-dependent flavin oxidoreductase YrpB (nitropropane dioxygenase family)